MKECKILTINDGWEVKHMIGNYNPGMIEEANFTFYKGGITFYLERDK